MAEPFHHRPRMRPQRDQHRRARVPQIVEPQPVRHRPRLEHSRFELAPVERHMSERPAALGPEQQAARVADEVLVQLAHEELR
ncbi:MAG: hypothetical protein R2770_18035 [Acidimicrobiales bacterium]